MSYPSNIGSRHQVVELNVVLNALRQQTSDEEDLEGFAYIHRKRLAKLNASSVVDLRQLRDFTREGEFLVALPKPLCI